jgi:hypothetical protein
MTQNGKGDTRRPKEVPEFVYEDNWERTFGPSKPTKDKPKETDNT